MNLIGISGKAGTGKTTLANLICDRTPGAVRWSYADALREDVAAILGCSVDFVRNPAFKGLHWRIGYRTLTGREVLQWYGTDVVRRIDPEHWIKRMEARFCGPNIVRPPMIMIDDLRFPDEAGLVERYQGTTVRLEPYPGWKPGPHADHPSETALDRYGRWGMHYEPQFGCLGDLADEILERTGARTEGAS